MSHTKNMIDATQNLILINGENKTSQIEEINRNDTGLFYVKYYGSPRIYTYNNEKIVWLTCPKLIDIKHTKIFIHHHRVYDLKKIFAFKHNNKIYWYVIHTNDYTQYLINEELITQTSCLSDKKSNNVFEYLKAVASSNILGKEEGKDDRGLLSKLYEGINFIDNSKAIASYLNPPKGLYKSKSGQLIFPFGCNSSQRQAVFRAFEHQISIIQGPPGTGKTNVIIEIILQILKANKKNPDVEPKKVLLVSQSHPAVDKMLEDLIRESDERPDLLRIGRDEKLNEEIREEYSINDVKEKWYQNVRRICNDYTKNALEEIGIPEEEFEKYFLKLENSKVENMDFSVEDKLFV